jgi:O-antigen ligase
VELQRYSWSGVTREDTSFGLRITYLRMAAELFVQHPLAGIGDTSRMAASDYPAFSYATPAAVASAYQGAFHNQIVSNTVRMGLPGLLSTTALLVTPVCIAIRGLRSRQLRTRRVAELGFAFGVTMLVSSLSTEVVDLKFMSSFYAVMTAVFVGAVLSAPDGDAMPPGPGRVAR